LLRIWKRFGTGGVRGGLGVSIFSIIFVFPESEDRIRVMSFNQIIQFNVEYKTHFVFGMDTHDDITECHDGRWYFKNLFVNAWLDREDIPRMGSMNHMAPERPKRMDPTTPEFKGVEQLSGT